MWTAGQYFLSAVVLAALVFGATDFGAPILGTLITGVLRRLGHYRNIRTGAEGLATHPALALSDFVESATGSFRGKVRVGSETWSAESEVPALKDTTLCIESVQALTLKVRPASKNTT